MEKILKKPGNFASPEKWEPCIWDIFADDIRALEFEVDAEVNTHEFHFRTLPDEAGRSQYQMKGVLMSDGGYLTPVR